MEASLDNPSTATPLSESESSQNASKPFEDDYLSLQRRTYMVILMVAFLVSAISALIFDLSISASLLLGSLFGLIYFRLLARSIGQLGNSSKSVSRVQLVVPVLLVVLVSKIPQLHLIPSLLGFLIYKPSLVFQALLFSYSKS